MSDRTFSIGLASAVGVIFIWSGFVVFSRMGVTSALTPQDVTALRFIVAGGITLPFAWAWWPRHQPLWVQALMAVTGPGILYGMLMYMGLTQASAAYGGVFANGSLPIFTALVVLAVTGVLPTRAQAIAIAVIVTGGVLLALRGLGAGGEQVGTGIAMFLAASATLSVYIFGLRHFRMSPQETLAVVNIPNALVWLPLWLWGGLPSGLAETPVGMIVFQALFQGLGPGFLAVILFTLSAKHLGATMTAGFSAVVPAVATVLAIPMLGEVPRPLEWAGIGLVSLGLWLLVRK